MGGWIDDKIEKEQISKTELMKEKEVDKTHTHCITDDALVLLY